MDGLQAAQELAIDAQRDREKRHAWNRRDRFCPGSCEVAPGFRDAWWPRVAVVPSCRPSPSPSRPRLRRVCHDVLRRPPPRLLQGHRLALPPVFDRRHRRVVWHRQGVGLARRTARQWTTYSCRCSRSWRSGGMTVDLFVRDGWVLALIGFVDVRVLAAIGLLHCFVAKPSPSFRRPFVVAMALPNVVAIPLSVTQSLCEMGAFDAEFGAPGSTLGSEFGRPECVLRSRALVFMYICFNSFNVWITAFGYLAAARRRRRKVPAPAPASTTDVPTAPPTEEVAPEPSPRRSSAARSRMASARHIERRRWRGRPRAQSRGARGRAARRQAVRGALPAPARHRNVCWAPRRPRSRRCRKRSSRRARRCCRGAHFRCSRRAPCRWST